MFADEIDDRHCGAVGAVPAFSWAAMPSGIGHIATAGRESDNGYHRQSADAGREWYRCGQGRTPMLLDSATQRSSRGSCKCQTGTSAYSLSRIAIAVDEDHPGHGCFCDFGMDCADTSLADQAHLLFHGGDRIPRLRVGVIDSTDRFRDCSLGIGYCVAWKTTLPL